MSLSRAEAERIATAIEPIRPHRGMPGHWDRAGIRAMIERGTPRQASYADALVAAVRMAQDLRIERPSADVYRSGPWWDTTSPGDRRPEWVSQRDACLVHPGQDRTTCRDCATERGPEIPPEERARLAAQIRAGLPGGKAVVLAQDNRRKEATR